MKKNKTGLIEGEFYPCASYPNCVSSQADPGEDPNHYIAPLELRELTPLEAWEKIISILEENPRCRIVELTEHYLRAEFTTTVFGFIDDLELHFTSKRGIIEVKSSSRIGYSDLGGNKKRVEKLRERFHLKEIAPPWNTVEEQKNSP